VLSDSSGEVVGTLLPGGYFTSHDGTYVVTQLDREAAVEGGNLAWARFVSRLNVPGAQGTGRFAHTRMIQRVDTTGGLPSQASCDLEGAGLTVHYSATYVIYR
jgi:hypothetical protein